MGVRGWVRCACDEDVTACPHADRVEAELDLAWRYIRSFRAELDEDDYPVLLRSIPESNGDRRMTPAEAAAALAELRRFESDHPPVPMDRLARADGTLICQTVHGETAWFYISALDDGTAVLAGIVAGGFGVWPDGGPPLFEAGVVEQRAVEGSLERLDPATGRVLRPSVQVELTDPATGRTLGLRRSVCDNAARFRAVTSEVPARERYRALDQLIELCLAATRTGHDVHLG